MVAVKVDIPLGLGAGKLHLPRLPSQPHSQRCLIIFTVHVPKETRMRHVLRGRWARLPVAGYLRPNPYFRVGDWGVVFAVYERTTR